MMTPFHLARRLGAAVLLALPTFGALAQAPNVGIGTTAPTQTLDVNGSLRVRGLSGTGDNRLLTVQPDGTLGVNAPVYGTAPAAPLTLSGTATTVAGPLSVAVSGTRAYVVGSNTLQVLDVSNPAAPVALGSVGTDQVPFTVAVSGTTAYVVNQNSNSLQTFDVSNPASPVLLATIGTGNNPLSVAVSGTLAYVVNISSGTLQVFDVSNPAAPVLRATVATGGSPYSVAAVGTTVYVVGYSNTLQVFDAATPTAPVLRGSIATGDAPLNVAASGTTVYVVNYNSNTLQTFSAANPAAPVLLATVPTGAAPHGVAVSGSTAYVVNRYANSLQAFDVSNPAAPVLAGSAATNNEPYIVAASGSTAYVVNVSSNTLQAFRFAGPTRTVAVNPDGSFSSLPLPAAPSGADFIQNQTSTNQAGGFRISGNGLVGGRVGVGTTSPSAKLTVQPGSDAELGLRITNGVADGTATSGNILLQTLTGGNSGFSTINFNGAYNGGEVRFNTTKNRWRLGVDQRGGGDGFFLETYDGTTGINVLRATTAGNVGIGTGSPSQRLDVAGNTTVTGRVNVDAANANDGTFTSGSPLKGLVFGDAGSGEGIGDNRAGSINSNGLDFYTNFTRRLAITNGGGVGVGTTNPAGQLANTSINTAGSGIHGGGGNSLSWAASQDGYVAQLYNQSPSGAGHGLLVKVDGTNGDPLALDVSRGTQSVSGASLLAVRASGNVGIGTLSPGAKLDVAGSANVQGNVGIGTTAPLTRLSISPGAIEPKITLWDGGSATSHYGFGISSGQLNYHVDGAGSNHVFYAGGKNGDGTELLRVQGNGNVGIGTSSPGQKLEVAGGIKFTGTGNALTFPDGSTQTTAAVTTPAITASNGLTRTGNDVALGGALTQATTLDQGANNLLLTGTGNLGVGQASPTARLDVASSLRVSSASAVGGAQLSQPVSTGSSNALTGQSFTLPVGTTIRAIEVFLTSATGTFSLIKGTPTSGTVVASQMVTYATGSTVVVLATPVVVTAPGVYSFNLGTGIGGSTYVTFANTDPYAGGTAFAFGAASGSDLKFGVRYDGQNDATLYAAPSGQVGVGTSSPTQALEVAGQVYSNSGGFRFPDNTVQTTAATAPNLTGDITSTGVATTYNNVVPATKGGAGTVSGLLKADGSGTVSAAVAGTDYAAATGSGAYVQSQTSTDQAGGFRVAGAGTVGGLLTASGGADLNVSGTAATNIGTGATSGTVSIGRVGGSTFLYGPVTVAGNANINTGAGAAITNIGTGTGSGAVSIGRSGGITGISGSTTITGTTNVNTSGTAATSIGNSTGALTLTGPTTVTGTVGITGATTVTGTATVSGNVGIGVASPGSRLYVRATDNTTSPIASFQPLNETQGVSVTYNGIAKTGSSATSDLTLDGKSTGNILLHTNGSTGSVGIGIAIPTQKLDVVGNVRVGTAGAPGKVLTNTTGTNNMLAAAYGQGGAGTTNVYGGSGNFTVTNPSTGVYTITFTAGSGLSGVNFDTAVMTASIYGSTPGVATVTGAVGSITIRTFTMASALTATPYFTFTVFVQ